MTYKELEHTADVKIRVVAPSLEALFGEAACALMEVKYGAVDAGPVRYPITVDADDPVSLVHDFLSELLYISEVEDLVVASADVSIRVGHLEGELCGERFDPAKHSGGTEVKGISYSGLSIRRDKENYILEVIFDV